MSELGVVLTTHTNRYIYKQGAALREKSGSEASIVPLRTLKRQGVHFALATDNVPVSLFHPIWHCVAREDRFGERIGAAEALSREDALRAATIEGAYITFEERERGSIEVGKLADLVVLSDDFLSVADDSLKDIVTEMTILGGRVVFDRNAGSSSLGSGASLDRFF